MLQLLAGSDPAPPSTTFQHCSPRTGAGGGTQQSLGGRKGHLIRKNPPQGKRSGQAANRTVSSIPMVDRVGRGEKGTGTGYYTSPNCLCLSQTGRAS